MSTPPNPCPICDHPIADTAYVCHRCARSLATQLLRAARLWRDLEDSLAGQIAEAIIASLRADLASGDPERVRETADALGLTVSPMAVVGGTSWSVRGISWYEPLKRDTLVPHDHTHQEVPQ